MRANVRTLSVVLARVWVQAQDQQEGGAKAPREAHGERRMIVDLERLLAVERIEDLRLEARMWHLERLLRTSPGRRSVARRVVALLGRRSSAREESAFSSAYETKERLDRNFSYDDPTSEREDPTFGGCDPDEQTTSLQTRKLNRQRSHTHKREVSRMCD